MSRGPGRIQRAVANAFADTPSAAFSVDELAQIAYPESAQIERKHRVALVRAADAAAEAAGWSAVQARNGKGIVYFNPVDMHSYALGRIRAKLQWSKLPVAEAAASLEPGGEHHKHIQPSGAWWLHVEITKAQRAGDTAHAQRLAVQLKGILESNFGSVDLAKIFWNGVAARM
jgi:hypothetical protein